MLFVTKRFLLAGIGLFAGTALATAAPYPPDTLASCPDGHCPTDHTAHHCATDECESTAYHDQAYHDHAHHDHAHPGHADHCESGCEHHERGSVAEYHPYHDSTAPPAFSSQRDRSFGIGSRWNTPASRRPFAPTHDWQPIQRQDRYLGHFPATSPTNPHSSTWDGQQSYGENPGRYRTLPAPNSDHLTISQPTRW